ncbi:copper resistance protein CopC [Amycolatopsis sp. NPDC004625]|uniref:copper resistance CopC/CopD family protein n=1 Tax=Amycolatopsis sp. NPDC004625 TaxID=3154670 RepID=UPI0033AF728D
MSARSVAAIGGTLLALLGAAVLLAGPAEAHAELGWSVPADGSSVPAAPGRIELHLTEPVEAAATRVTLRDDTGRAVATGTPASAATGPEQPATLTIPLPPLPAGTYRLGWATVSSDDLHPTTGTLVFGVDRPVAPATVGAPADPLPAPGEVAAQWALYLGFAGWAGAVVLTALLGRAVLHRRWAGPARRRLLRFATGSAVFAVLAGAAVLVVRAAQLGGDPVATAWSLVAGSPGGTPWLVREGLLAASAVTAVWLLRSGRPVRVLPAVLGTGTAAATAWQGHLAASGPLWLATDTAHVLAAVVWGGTVLAAAVALPGARTGLSRRAARILLRRFGFVALGAVTVLTATGLLLAGDRIASVDALLFSTYGRTILVKVSLVAIAALSGLFTTIVLHRRRGRRTGRLVRVEAAVLAGVFGVTAGLVSTHQAAGPQWQPPAASAGLTGSAQADDLVETLSVRPGIPGRNFLTAGVFDTRRPAPAPIQGVTFTLRGPAGGVRIVPATPAENGTYVAAADLDAPGAWQVTAIVARPGLAPAAQDYHPLIAPATRTAREPRVSQDALTPVTGRLAALVLAAGLAAALAARRRPPVTGRTKDRLAVRR